jgi:aspartate-semialdehyde dehydrogenase
MGRTGKKMSKKKVAIIGATGIAGQQFVAALGHHPQFEVTVLAASARSAGKTYLEALKEPSGAIGWWGDEALPSHFAQMPVVNSEEFDAQSVDVSLPPWKVMPPKLSSRAMPRPRR